MNKPELAGPDPVRTRLRITIAKLDQEISALPQRGSADDSTGPTTALRAAFADLVQQLALGPEPALRACPACRYLGMRTATVCGTCWTKLTPPDPEEAAA